MGNLTKCVDPNAPLSRGDATKALTDHMIGNNRDSVAYVGRLLQEAEKGNTSSAIKAIMFIKSSDMQAEQLQEHRPQALRVVGVLAHATRVKYATELVQLMKFGPVEVEWFRGDIEAAMLGYMKYASRNRERSDFSSTVNTVAEAMLAFGVDPSKMSDYRPVAMEHILKCTDNNDAKTAAPCVAAFGFSANELADALEKHGRGKSLRR